MARVALRALRHRNYQLFFGGQLISLTGTWMQQIAQSWLVYRLTQSAALLGLVSFAGQIPVFLFAPIGGAVADRVSRHRIVVLTQTAAMVLAFILAALTLSGAVRVWHLFVLTTLLGIINAFDIPARQAFMVDMVGRDDLIRPFVRAGLDAIEAHHSKHTAEDTARYLELASHHDLAVSGGSVFTNCGWWNSPGIGPSTRPRPR